jgi:adenosine deaminase
MLGVERIGHGVRAVEDPALVDYLAAHEIPLEVCPTSNIRTGIYPSYSTHPVKRLFEAGVPITINSDDPSFFGTTLADELQLLCTLGMKESQVRQIVRNGFAYSFLPVAEGQRFIQALDKAWPIP